MPKFTKLIAPLAIVVGLLPVAAISAPERRAVVDTAGIDLSTAAGVVVLDKRIAAAVRSVCGLQVAGHSIVGAAVRACRSATLDSLEARKLALISAQHRVATLAGR